MVASFHISPLDDPADVGVHNLLVEFAAKEQAHYDHPPRSQAEIVEDSGPISRHFVGENVVLVARDDAQAAIGLVWCVLFDPGTGLEGELAELVVDPQWRGQGVATELCKRAMALFRERAVSFVCVWTRGNNPAALAAYRRAGFTPTEQEVLTWLPLQDNPAS